MLFSLSLLYVFVFVFSRRSRLSHLTSHSMHLSTNIHTPLHPGPGFVFFTLFYLIGYLVVFFHIMFCFILLNSSRYIDHARGLSFVANSRSRRLELDADADADVDRRFAGRSSFALARSHRLELFRVLWRTRLYLCKCTCMFIRSLAC